MTTVDLLESLNKLGIKVYLTNDDLKISAPPGLLIPDLVQIIKAHKPEIMKTLKTSDAGESLVNKISISNDAVDYVDKVFPPNSQFLENNFQEKMDYVDYEKTEANTCPLCPHNPTNPSKQISDKGSNLHWWIDRVKRAQSQQEICDILARFQPLDWTDAERAVMSHAYIHRLEVLEALPEVGRLMSRHLKPGSKA